MVIIIAMKALLAAVGLITLCSLGIATSLEAAVLVRISNEETTYQVVEVGGEVWLAMESGAYRVIGNSPTPVLKDVPVTAIADIGGQIWLGTMEGVFRVEGDKAVPFLRDTVGKLPITVLKADLDIVWLGNRRGLYRIERDTASLIFEDLIHDISKIDGQIWLSARSNAYRLVDPGSPQPLFGEPTAVSETVKAAGSIWLVTNAAYGRYGPCFRLNNGQPTLVPSLQGHEVISVTEVGGEAWFATTEGVLRLAGDIVVQIAVAGLGEPVNTIKTLDGQTWLGSTHRAYRRSAGNFVPTPETAKELNIKGIDRIVGRTWLWGETGAYRFDEDVDLWLRPTTHSVLGQEVLFGRVVRIKEARYDREGKTPYSSSAQADIKVIVESDLIKFTNEIDLGEYHPAKSLERTVPYGLQDVHIMARDAYGNSLQIASKSVLVIPGPIVATVTGLIAWWLLAILILVAAPWSKLFMNLALNPKIRAYGSLWAIPVLLSFPLFRRHLLRRYVNELLSAGETSKPEEDDRLLTSAESIDGVLTRRRWLQITGTPDETKRFLNHLTDRLAAGKKTARPLRKFAPISLHLKLHAESKKAIEEGAISHLKDYGINDDELARSFLNRGRFIFLFDGLGQLDDKERLAVELFIDGYRNRNLFIVCTDGSGDNLNEFLAISPFLPVTTETQKSTQDD